MAILTSTESSLVGCPVLSEKRQKLRGAFVGEMHPRTLELIDLRCARDQFAKLPGPLDREEQVTGTPCDKGGYPQLAELRPNSRQIS